MYVNDSYDMLACLQPAADWLLVKAPVKATPTRRSAREACRRHPEHLSYDSPADRPMRILNFLCKSRCAWPDSNICVFALISQPLPPSTP